MCVFVCIFVCVCYRLTDFMLLYTYPFLQYTDAFVQSRPLRHAVMSSTAAADVSAAKRLQTIRKHVSDVTKCCFSKRFHLAIGSRCVLQNTGYICFKNIWPNLDEVKVTQTSKVLIVTPFKLFKFNKKKKNNFNLSSLKLNRKKKYINLTSLKKNKQFTHIDN